MKKILQKLFFVCTIALWSICSTYARTYCNYTCNEFKKDGAFVTLTWTTAANGDVVIYIGKGESAYSAEFRNGGFEGGLDNGFSVLSGDGFATVESASTYFTRNGNGLSSDNLVFTLNKKADVDLPNPCQIQFHTEAFSWKANGKDYYTKPYVMTYDYNSAACGQLDAPTDVAITQDGKLTFTGVQGATWYEARLYFNGDQKYSQVVTSGSTITYTPLVSGTYQVKVVALGYDILNSAESAGVDWELTAQEIEVGPSEYCSYPLFSNTNKAATFTWETTEDGDVVITIGASTAGEAFYRGDGFCGTSLDRFTVGAGKSPASNYFERVYAGAGSSTYTLKLKNGVTPPVKGEKINFEGKTVEWKTEKDGNAYDNLTFIYTYGSVCQSLDAPTDVAVSTDSVITFTASAGATSYEALVYLAGTMMYEQTVVSGDVLHFFPLKDGDYSVTVVAKAEGMTDSEESVPYIWTLTKREVILPNSEYCGKVMGSGNNQAQFTWVTLANGDIEVTLAEPDGTVDAEKTVFRANAIKLADLKVGKAAMSDYFISSFANNVQTFFLKDADKAPGLGEKITYNAVVEYKVVANNDAWPTLKFDYTYGSVCQSLDAPEHVAITEAGVITFDAVDDAEGYLVRVYDGTNLKLEQPVSSGSIVKMYSFVDKTYQVCVVATKSTARSDESERVNWSLKSSFLDVASEYCKVTPTGYHVVFDWQTNTDGDVVITISEGDGGAEGTTHFRAQGMSNDALEKFKVNGEAAGNYFIRQYTTDDAVYTLKLKPGVSLAPGTTITHVGDVEYVSESEGGNAYHNFGFSYTYGTACSDTKAPEMDAPQAEALNATTIRLTLNATDNFGGDITYVVSRTGADDITTTGPSGVATTVDVTGLTTGTEYTFSVVAKDELGYACDPQECKATPAGDAVAPSNVSISAVAVTDKIVRLTMYADDNVPGQLLYNIAWVGGGIAQTSAERSTEVIYDVTGLTPATEYTFTLTVKDAANNWSAPVNSNAVKTFSGNLALNKPSEASIYQNPNVAKNANDGNENNWWTSWGQQADEYWWKVDMEAVYDVKRVRILFNDHAGTYNLYGSIDGTNWTIYVANFTIDNNHIDYVIEAPISTRYFKFTSTNANVGIKEFEAYGMPNVDTEKPVMVSAAVNSKDNSSAIINVSATDNILVTSYLVYQEATLIGEYTPAQNQITITGLNADTEYTFDIKAKDLSGNISDNSQQVTFKTDKTAAENPYCETEIWHLMAATPEQDSYVLLSVGADGNGNTVVNIKQDTEKNQVKFDYLQVSDLATTGIDLTMGGVTELGVSFATPAADADGNITLEIQWSIVNSPDRWKVENIKVPAMATCASAVVALPNKDIYDYNYALKSNGSSATASSGIAERAIDGVLNGESRWESAATDNEWWMVDMNAYCTFNAIQMRWEGAYTKTFDILVSNNGTNWTTIKQVDRELPSPANYEETIEVEETTARFVKFQTIKRGTVWGNSFWEFRVLKTGAQVLTTFSAAIANPIMMINTTNAITITAKDQNGIDMDPGEITYEITPSDAGEVVNGQFIATKAGSVSIVAKTAEKTADAVTTFVVKNGIISENKPVEGDGDNDVARVNDGDDATEWQGSRNGAPMDTTVSFVMDLNSRYMIELITIHFEGACSNAYTIETSSDNVNWNTAATFEGAYAIYNHTDYIYSNATIGLTNTEKVRYIRFTSTKSATEYGMKIFEFTVYGEEYLPPFEIVRSNLSEGALGTICLPFDVPADDRQGAVFYSLDYTDGSFIHFIEETGTLEAGRAYIFQAEDEQITMVKSDTTATSPETDAIITRGLYGTYVDITPGNLTGKYVIANDYKIHICGSGAYLNANRAYIDLDAVPTTPLEINDPAGAPTRRMLTFGGAPHSVTTESENVNGVIMHDGAYVINDKLVIIRNGKRYNAVGQRVK